MQAQSGDKSLAGGPSSRLNESDLFVKIFGPDAGHVRLVYGVQSLPMGAPLVVEAVFEIEPARRSMVR